ncbi:hypothetical protein [Cellulomonas soli]
MDVYVLHSGFDSVVHDDAACSVRAVCVAASRMSAVELFRARGLMGVSSRGVRRAGADHDGPTPAVGEVWVRPLYVDGVWSRR